MYPAIKDIIPHRYPFLLVDKILEVEPMKRCVGQKNVSHNEHFFQGHYPDYPVMPGVLIVEALAQLGAYLLLSADEYRGRIPLFRGIDKAKFKRQVIPGDVLQLEIELLRQKGDIGLAKATASVGGELCCHCELTFFVH